MRVAIGLGSSLGDRRAVLERTVRQIAASPGLHVLRASRWYRTPPLRGGTARGWFLNGAVLVESELPPHALLGICRALEERSGRRRAGYWGDRTLDLDLLLAEATVVHDDELTLPHAAISQRPFVLVPLLEVWPDAVDPRTGRPLALLPPPPGPRPAAVGVASSRSARPLALSL